MLVTSLLATSSALVASTEAFAALLAAPAHSAEDAALNERPETTPTVSGSSGERLRPICAAAVYAFAIVP